MAFFTKDHGRERRADPSVASAAPVTRTPGEVEMLDRDEAAMRGSDGSGLIAFLGKGTRITGTLVFEGPCRIEGHVEGEVTARDTLTVGESAVVNARVSGSTVVIHGTVTGDVVAATRLEIRAPGKVIGDVSTPSLVINEGAVLEGRCSMRSATVAEETHDIGAAAPAAPQSHSA